MKRKIAFEVTIDTDNIRITELSVHEGYLAPVFDKNDEPTVEDVVDFVGWLLKERLRDAAEEAAEGR